MKGKSVRHKNKTAKKLHQQFEYPTHDKLLQLVKTSGAEDGKFQDQLKKVSENCITCIKFNPIRPGLFSRSPGPGGSEAQMPKIKVNINQLK